MKKSFKMVAALLSACIVMSSCMGSFGLTKKLYNWNEGVGDKWANEIVFVAMNIIPVYSITLFVDAVVLNSVEFWTGNKALANNGEVKIVKNSKGEEVTITANENGYNISNGETAMNFIFDEADNSWSVEYNNTVNKLISIDGDNAQLYMLNGETVNVTLDEAGVAMARQMVMGDYAQR
ncbi:MAG: DUF3332 domain-containing protein [Bacteroidaceae bacterium]|nr:DUF3332 domain-containing protein [Bacteroidaceae bacterium]